MTGEAVTREQEAVRLAAELIVFADGAEQGGLTEYAQRARVVARETLYLAEQIILERHALEQIQARNDTMLAMLAERVFCRRCETAMRKAVG